MADRPPVRLTEAQIRQMAAARGLDPDAVIRVASAEGLSGGIGDGGHAFGPFQLNNAGGVITGKFRGQTPERINGWAWSPQGVSYALDGISKVAKGLHGADAVRAIVTRFERPANPQGEIARALAYGGGAGAGGLAGPSGQPAATPAPTSNPGAPPIPAPQPDRRRALLMALAQASTQPQPNYTPFLNLLRQRAQAPTFPAMSGTTPGPTAASPPAPATASPSRGGIAELLHEGVGGPTHSTGEHIHSAYTNPQTELAAIRQAQQLGLAVRENPYTDTVDPVHAKNSYHYRTFPGRYNGRSLGEAFDASGPQSGMMALYKWLQARR